MSGLKNNKPSAPSTEKVAKDGLEVLKPLKVFQNTRIALSQLSVWVLAVAIIPPLCNAIIAPIMKKIGPKIESLAEKKPVEVQSVSSKPTFQSNNDALKNKNPTISFQGCFTNYSSGMRV